MSLSGGGAGSPGRRGTRVERAVVLFVVAALAALVAVPIVVNARVTEMRDRIEALEHTRTLVTRLEFNLVQEMAALSEAMLTQDRAALSEYAAAVEREDSIFRELQKRAPELGPDLLAQFNEVRGSVAVWHERAADPEDLLEDFGSATLPRPRRERQLFAALLTRTRELDQAILDRIAGIRTSIAGAERLGLNLSVALGFLALGVGGAAALLAGRSHRFAAESARRRAEAEAALEQLARQAELRERLLQGITHDVKNPLAAVQGYAELLEMGLKAPLHPAQEPLVRGIQRAVHGALEIVEDLLDLARADSGRLTIEPARVDLPTLVDEVVADYRAHAEAVGHSIRHQSPGSPVRLETDPVRVRQILENLLTNAIKYTPPPGAVTVSTRVEGAAQGGGGEVAIVRVRDTGPGIPAEMRERIFDEFTRLEDKELVKGHGLGLAIARRVARLLGGDLKVEEADGPGATFALILPLARGADDGVAPPAPERSHPNGLSSAEGP